MKKIIFLLLVCIPFVLIAQTNNVVNATRIFPKATMVAAFEKALAAHVNKYHSSGKWKWRVYDIETGPDVNGYHIIEGPNSWEDFDKRGDLGKEHMDDWQTNVLPTLSEKNEEFYVVYREDLSSTAIANYADKIAINHVFYKPGYSGELEEVLKTLKPAWEAGNQNIAVYELSSSGEAGFNIVTRYKDGLKERDPSFRTSMKIRYEKINGVGAWQNYQDQIKKCVDHSWSELLEFRADLSAK